MAVILETDEERFLRLVGGVQRADVPYENRGPEDVCSRCGLPASAASDPPALRLFAGPRSLTGRVMKFIYCGPCQVVARETPAPARRSFSKWLEDRAIDAGAPAGDSTPATKPENEGGFEMADESNKAKGAIVVGTKVRLRDGREGNVSEVSGNQIVVTTGDGNTIEAPMSEAEAVDEGEAGAAA